MKSLIISLHLQKVLVPNPCLHASPPNLDSWACAMKPGLSIDPHGGGDFVLPADGFTLVCIMQEERVFSFIWPLVCRFGVF